jgi:hypothetical protein
MAWREKKIDLLRAAELSGLPRLLEDAELSEPRSKAIYFRVARFMISGLCPEEVGAFFTNFGTPERLRKVADCLEIIEEQIDRSALRLTQSYLAAFREAGEPPTLQQIRTQYIARFGERGCPVCKSIGRSLNRKQLLYKKAPPGPKKK